jgi:hypothetical protein
VKYGKGGTQQLQQVQPFVQSAATRHGSRVENLEHSDSKTSLETSTHLSYRSMSKAILYQKHPKQRLWQHKHIYTPRGQAQRIQEIICIEQHYKD